MSDNIKLPPYPEGLCLREDIEDYAREAVRLNAQVVPDGWVMVPIKPTLGMIDAGADCDPERESVWDAMLSAAPAAPQPAQPLTEKDALLRQALEALEAYSKSGYVRHEHPKKYAAGNAVAEAIRSHLGVKND